MVEKVEVRSHKDSVKFSFVMPDWFCNLGDDVKKEITTGLDNYVNLFEQMIESEESMRNVNLLMAKGMLLVIEDVLSSSLGKQ